MEPIILSTPARLRDWVQLYMLYRASFPPAERKPFPTILKNTGPAPPMSGASGRTAAFWALPPP